MGESFGLWLEFDYVSVGKLRCCNSKASHWWNRRNEFQLLIGFVRVPEFSYSSDFHLVLDCIVGLFGKNGAFSLGESVQ